MRKASRCGVVPAAVLVPWDLHAGHVVGFALLAAIGTAALTTAARAQGGENVATAVPIEFDTPTTGTTVGYANDYDEACPFSGSTSPDVVYSYAPDGPFGVGLCEPGYPCVLTIPCPAGGILENEVCHQYTSGFDDLNGGCNSSPPVFSDLVCDTTYCGTIYFDGAFRDTDWWELDDTANDAGTTYVITGLAEFNSVYGRVQNNCGALDCSQVSAFAEVGVFPQCTPVLVTAANLTNCLAWFFVGTDFSQIVDCTQPAGGPPNEVGDHYVLEVECHPCCGLPCPWDFNLDHQVGFADLVQLLSNWGPCPGA